MQEILQIATGLDYRLCKWGMFRYDSDHLCLITNHLHNTTGYLRDYLEYFRNWPSTADIADVVEFAGEVTGCLINYRMG